MHSHHFKERVPWHWHTLVPSLTRMIQKCWILLIFVIFSAFMPFSMLNNCFWLCAERAWPGVGCSHRTVAAEEKQSPQWEKRTAGGASRAHPRGGTVHTQLLFLCVFLLSCCHQMWHCLENVFIYIIHYWTYSMNKICVSKVFGAVQHYHLFSSSFPPFACVFSPHTGISAASWPVHERWAAAVLYQRCRGEWGRVCHLHTVRLLTNITTPLLYIFW